MRTISTSTLKKFWTQFRAAEQPLKSWTQEVKKTDWQNSAELKKHFRTASIISAKRVVFNIKGNDFRLVADIDYRLKIIFIVWVGTHASYDKIDINTISYVRTN